MKKHSYIAKTIDEAINQATIDLQETKEKLFFQEKEIKGGLFKGKKIEIEVVTIREALDFAKEYIKKIINDIGLSVQIETKKRDNTTTFVLYSDNNALLIGKLGRTMLALTTVVHQVVAKEVGSYVNFIIDVGEYKENREKDLEYIARRTAKEVSNTKIEAKLDSMNSYERRIIHNALNNNKYVYTESVGEEPNRCVIIKPRD